MRRKLFIIIICLVCIFLPSCVKKSVDDVVIYTSLLDYRREYLVKRLNEQFPEYKIRVEYMPTGNHAAKLLAEGVTSDCDITHDLEYGYMTKLAENKVLADLSSFEHPIYIDDADVSSNFFPKERNGNAIILNREVLASKGLDAPTSYDDLLDPKYKNLISIPNPKASSSGYALLKSLVNTWGEDEAFEYFEKLTNNVSQYPSSGSGAVNAVVQGEAAIGFGILQDAVRIKNEGAPIDIVFFEEGAPYALYGQGIIKGKEEKKAVKEVFDFLINIWDFEDLSLYSPEKIYRDIDFELDNFPKNIKYSDMSNNTPEEKDRLLDKWQY